MVVIVKLPVSKYKISNGGLFKLSWVKSQNGIFDISETSIWSEERGDFYGSNSIALISNTQVNDTNWSSINGEAIARQYIKRTLFIEALW